MLAAIVALSLLTPQSNSPRLIRVPMAKVQAVFPREFEPVAPNKSSREESKGRMGWETESIWRAETPAVDIRLTYWTYAKNKKPLLSPKELATELYSNSELISDPEELARQYADRKVIDAKIGIYLATIDLHHDKEENRHYGTLAFGDDREQWLVETRANAKVEGTDRTLRSVIASIKPIDVPNDVLAKSLLKMVALPGTGFEIGAPACFAARVPYAEAGRPKLWSHWYVLDLGDEFSISVQDNAYSDKKTPNLKADLDYLLGSFRDGTRQFLKGEDVEGKTDGWATRMRVQPYTHAGKQSTIVWTYWASPGRTIFGVVKVSDRLGGTARAREIAQSLRPMKKAPAAKKPTATDAGAAAPSRV